MSAALWRAAAWVSAVALLVVGAMALGRELAINRYLAALHRAEDRAQALSDSLVIALRTVRVDSVESERVVTRWRVVRDSLVDTVEVHTSDTVRVLVTAAEQAIDECQRARRSCGDALALALRRREQDSLALRGLTTQLAVEQTRARPTWRYRVEGAAACALGVWAYTRTSGRD